MIPTDLTISDFQPHELGPKPDRLSVLVAVAERAREKLAAAKISQETISGGVSGSSTNPAKIRRKTLSLKRAPAEVVPQHNRLSTPIAQTAATKISKVRDGGGSSTHPAKRRKIHSRNPDMIARHSLPPPKPVVQKLLLATKLSAQHNRLSVPIAQIAAVKISEARDGGGSSTNQAKRRKILSRNPAPAEGLTNMINMSAQHNRLSIPIAQIAAAKISEAHGGGGSITNPVNKRKIHSRNPAPAEGLTNMINMSAKHNRPSIPIAQIAAAKISEAHGGGGSSTNLAKRRKIHSRNPAPAEGLTNMINTSAQHNRLSILAKISEARGGGGSTNPAKRREILSRNPIPGEGLTNMVHHLSHERGIAPPPQLKHVIQKKLFPTDLSAQHNRFSIPISQISDDFLTDAEKQRLRSEDKQTNYLNVKIMAAAEAGELATETVKLSRWDMRKGRGRNTSSSMYAINGKWNAFVKKIDLTVGMVVQLWFFRLRSELCFALVQLPDSSEAASASA